MSPKPLETSNELGWTWLLGFNQACCRLFKFPRTSIFPKTRFSQENGVGLRMHTDSVILKMVLIDLIEFNLFCFESGILLKKW